ncbi:SidA/IucD/PvdA family monooxygenase [Salmonella enterica]|nr:SidA/IucD/PvdA family monooxygenase [Salmonella enterica]
MDESSFTNELPEYSDYFYRLPDSKRHQLLTEQKLASDGISAELLELIYRRLYELRHVLRHLCTTHLLPGRELTRVEREQSGWSLSLSHVLYDGVEVVDTHIVVLCTGYVYDMLSCLAHLANQIHRSDTWESQANEDYSIDWDGAEGSRIYVQNAARTQRGIAAPNLGMIPWRSAMIINSVVRRDLYDVVGPTR